VGWYIVSYGEMRYQPCKNSWTNRAAARMISGVCSIKRVSDGVQIPIGKGTWFLWPLISIAFSSAFLS